MDAISAMETSTSALMSNAVTSQMIASRMMGIPQSKIAIHAKSNGNGITGKMLSSSAIPESTRQVMSF